MVKDTRGKKQLLHLVRMPTLYTAPADCVPTGTRNSHSTNWMEIYFSGIFSHLVCSLGLAMPCHCVRDLKSCRSLRLLQETWAPLPDEAPLSRPHLWDRCVGDWA